MIHITIQTRTVEAAERLALHLMERGLLLFPTLDTDHEELTVADGTLRRDRQLLLQKARPRRCSTAMWSAKPWSC